MVDTATLMLTPAMPPDCSKETSVFAEAAAGAAASATMSAKGRSAFMHARLPNDGPRRHLPPGRGLAPRRLDGPRAGPAHRRRVALHRRGGLPRDLQRPAVLAPRLALAPARRPSL